MRLESDHPWPGPAGGWLHKLNGDKIDLPPPRREKPKAVRDWTAEARRNYLHPQAGAMREYLAETLGLSVDVLERFRVGWTWQQWSRDFGCEYSTWPTRDAKGMVTGVSLRARDGKKLMMRGSTAGLFYCRGWQKLSDTIYIPEGATDAAALTAMGLSAVGRASNLSAPWLPDLLMAHRDREIVVLGEHDRVEPGVRPGCLPDCHGCSACWPGRHGAETVAEMLAGRLRRAVTWWVLAAKDVRVWAAENPDWSTANLGTIEFSLYDFKPAMVGVAGRETAAGAH